MMGHYADRFPAKLKRVNQKYFLNTAADPPFASKWRRFVTVDNAFEKLLPCCDLRSCVSVPSVSANISVKKCYIIYQNSSSTSISLRT